MKRTAECGRGRQQTTRLSAKPPHAAIEHLAHAVWDGDPVDGRAAPIRRLACELPLFGEVVQDLTNKERITARDRVDRLRLYRETTCERILLKGLDAADVAQLIADSGVPAERRDIAVIGN